ncbi:MAG TPA: PASTA domain-containing protein [Solirubrobacteraceae bacterium]|jgi:beta-lactam-binding protein with PASTA domain|nr:PASTA domain-containing protein [Solirubrobacteraceae bacterium]
MIDAGTVIDGRYEVLSRIGTGGMADVYLARDQLLGRQVAVKLLHHRFAEDQEFVERFRREASSAASLSHPNVVAIFDRGEWDGTYYIAMEYLPGLSVKTVVREQSPLDPVAAIDIVAQILQAARFAHGRGVIHRDLKPHNVILDAEGRAKVTDFGIARAGASDMTLTGSIMGTAQYLSPEQAQGQAVSAASDLYAVGIVLYELLTGAVPFDGETAVTIALKQVSATPPPPSALNAAVPPELDAVVLRALAKDPAERFADAGEFLAALEYVRHLLAGGARHGVGAGNGPVPATALLMAPVSEPVREADGAAVARRRRWWWWAAGALLLALAAAAALLLLLPSKHEVTVPNVTGQSQAVASSRLAAVGLTAVPSPTASTVTPAGVVFGETPPHGSLVDRGSRVTLLVSSGPGSAALPSVKGLTGAQAMARLTKAGFKPSTESQASATVPAGKAISTEPSAHTEAQLGSPVTVFVSSGPAAVRVPEVTGQSEAEAKASLRAVGLEPGTVTKQEAASAEAGTVLSQSPPAGGSLARGQSVNLVVGQAPKELEVPRVVGKSEAQAAGELGLAGFKPKSATRTVSKPEEVGIVLAQSPAGGGKAKRGATVTITIGALGQQTTPSTTTTTPPPTTTPSTTTTPASAPPAGP